MASRPSHRAYPEYRLQPAIEAFLLEQCELQHRMHARIHLDFGSQSGVDGFVTALEGEMEVVEDVLDSDPEEICVKASGTGADGTYRHDSAIILLAPHWAKDAESSRHLADIIVSHWERLCEIHAITKNGDPK